MESRWKIKKTSLASGVITVVRDTGAYLKVWSHLYEAQKAYPKIRVFEQMNPDLKRLRHFCSGKAPALLHPSLYRGS